jgi:hypothetical protein
MGGRQCQVAKNLHKPTHWCIVGQGETDNPLLLPICCGDWDLQCLVTLLLHLQDKKEKLSWAYYKLEIDFSNIMQLPMAWWQLMCVIVAA